MSGEIQLNTIKPTTSAKLVTNKVQADTDLYFDTQNTSNTDTLYNDTITFKKDDLTGVLKDAVDLIPQKEEWSQKELCEIICLNCIKQITNSSNTSIENQDKKDGAISKFFNDVKEWTGLGTSKSDAIYAIKNQDKITELLIDEIEKENGDFTGKFKELTGFEYDEEAFFKYIENEMYVSMINYANAKINVLENNFKECTDFNQAFKVLNEYYNGDETLSLKALNHLMNKRQERWGVYNSDVSVVKDKNGNITLSGKDSEDMNIEGVMYDAITLYDSEYATNEFSENFKTSMGISAEDCYSNYAISYAEAFSNIEDVQKVQTLEKDIDEANTLEEVLIAASKYYDEDVEIALEHLNKALKSQNLETISTITNENDEIEFVLNINGENYPLNECNNVLKSCMFEPTKKELIENYEQNSTLKSLNAKDTVTDYIESQEGAIKKGAQVIQVGGLVVVVAGGIASVAGFPEAGIPMISFGQKMAIGGMFADNALQTIDTLTSEQDNQDKFNEIKEVGKETFVEGALLASGMGIGKLSSGANASITASTQSKALGTLAEVGIDGTLSLAADFMITGEFNLEQEGFSQLLNILTGIATAKNIEYKTQLNDIEAKKTYLKNIEVKPDKINTGLKLFDMGFSDIAIKYLSKLDDIQIDKAINLKAKGYPDYYLADAVCLNEVQFKRLNTLEEMNVSKYYITQFASLNGESYKKALELIETTDLNAPSILDIVTSEKTNWDNLIKNYTTGKTKKAQVNDEVMQALDAQAYKLSRFGIENIDEIGDFTREILDDATITQRSKSYESIYKKLISKYENIGKEGWVSDYNFALDSIGDIYGTRLNFENLKASNYPKEVSEILNKKNMTLEQFNSIVKEATISGDLSKLDDDCINLINIIKTNQSQPFVEKLCKGIESGEIKITTLNNYGNEITSYLTNEQILQIAQSFQIAKSKNLVDWNLEIVSRQFDKEMFSNLSTESITGEPIKTFNDENSLENITVLKPNKAVKDSGYAALQMNIKYDIEGQGELQARGSILDGFADREHIPYDIRKGKITPKDTQYKEIYDIIKNMSEEGYIEYNKYLTNVYSALRLQEMGISCNIPEIPNNITNSNGYLFSEASLEKISYENIMLLEH